MKKVVQAFILILSLVGLCNSQESESQCDFSSYNPLVISHALLGTAIKKVVPEYPPIARAAHVKGEVQVKILVDRKGNVVESCVAHGHPLLRDAAEKAALEWKFKRNFGFSSKSKFKQQYIQSWLVFNFRVK